MLVTLRAEFSNAVSGDAAWTQDRNDLFWYANALILAAGSVCRAKQHRQIRPILAATGGLHPVTVLFSVFMPDSCDLTGWDPPVASSGHPLELCTSCN